MVTKKNLVIGILFICFSYSAYAEDIPPKMLNDIECFKRHGLIQGTVDEAMRGDAHFAVFFQDTKIGGRRATLRFNGAFIEGKTKISPEIVKTCNPNLTLKKNSP
jgi:hypothetical protein